MSDRTYTVEWRRPDGEKFQCTNLSARIAFARLWAALRSSGEITVTAVTPEFDDVVEPSEAWPYTIAPPDCQDARTDGWTCIVYDGTGLWCDACTLWNEENAALLEDQ